MKCYDVLIADISNDRTDDTSSALSVTDNDDEWVGLEETIELSLRERRASDCQAPSVGEFSKVRK